MRYGYARVSSKGQKLYGMSLEEQRKQLLSAGADVVVDDAYTGTEMERPKFSALMEQLQPGDELIVCKLDRFARTAPEGALVVRDLVDRGVRVNIMNMGIADNTPMGKVMVTVMLAFAEFERDMIVERTQAGKAAKRASDPDYKEGRHKVEVDTTELDRYCKMQQAGEITAAQAAERLGISRATYYNLVRGGDSDRR